MQSATEMAGVYKELPGEIIIRTERWEISREKRQVANKCVQVALRTANTVYFFWGTRLHQPVYFPDTELCTNEPDWLMTSATKRRRIRTTEHQVIIGYIPRDMDEKI